MSKNEQVVTKKVIKYCGNNGSCLKERLKENERKERQEHQIDLQNHYQLYMLQTRVSNLS